MNLNDWISWMNLSNESLNKLNLSNESERLNLSNESLTESPNESERLNLLNESLEWISNWISRMNLNDWISDWIWTTESLEWIAEPWANAFIVAIRGSDSWVALVIIFEQSTDDDWSVTVESWTRDICTAKFETTCWRILYITWDHSVVSTGLTLVLIIRVQTLEYQLFSMMDIRSYRWSVWFNQTIVLSITWLVNQINSLKNRLTFTICPTNIGTFLGQRT